MSKLTKLRVALERMLLEYSHVATDKGVLYYDGLEDRLEKGINVYVEDENQNKVKAEAGEYVSEMYTIIVADGKVTDIIDKEREEEVIETKEDVKMEEQTAETKPEDVTEPVEEPKPEETKTEEVETGSTVNEVDVRITELEAKVADAEAKKAEYDAKVADLEAQLAAKKAEIEELKKKPAAAPAAEDFEKSTKVEKTGNKGLDNLANFLNAGRK